MSSWRKNCPFCESEMIQLVDTTWMECRRMFGDHFAFRSLDNEEAMSLSGEHVKIISRRLKQTLVIRKTEDLDREFKLFAFL